MDCGCLPENLQLGPRDGPFGAECAALLERADASAPALQSCHIAALAIAQDTLGFDWPREKQTQQIQLEPELKLAEGDVN